METEEQKKAVRNLYAYIITADDGEHICANASKDGIIPMVSEDLVAMKEMKPMADDIEKMYKFPVTLCHYQRVATINF